MTRVLLTSALLIPLMGCAALDFDSGARLRRVASNADVAMSADYRMVYKRNGSDGRVYCAEPSPDIGRIVSAASQVSASGTAKGAKVQPELALAFAASRAEGLAQLGQRLATIQLLRDSTFRACEAFANKAISASTYAMIVSRYDDVMITLMLGEMAASGSRPSSTAALLTGRAGIAGLTQATGDVVVKDANARLAAADAQLKAATDARGKLAAGASETERTAAQTAVASASKEREQAASLLATALAAVVGTSAEANASAAAGPADGGSSTVAQQLLSMQRAYLDDFNLDAVTVGCLSALSQLDPPVDERGIGANLPRGALVPLPANDEPGVGGGFASTSVSGAYNLQDECRATLLNGSTLRAAARARIAQQPQSEVRRQVP